MPYKEKDIKKIYWTVGEISKELDLLPSTIPYWESEFPHLKPRKKYKGKDRRYTKKERDAVHYIHFLLKVQKHTIDGAKEIIKHRWDSEMEQLERLIPQFENSEFIDPKFVNGMKWKLRALKAEELLSELCQLKSYKDEMGKDEFYQERKPQLWAEANEHLNTITK